MSDFRYMTTGPYRFCYSEVKMGLIFPEIFLDIIKSFARSDIFEIVMQARPYKPHEALQAGLVHDVFEPEKALFKTLRIVSGILASPLAGYQETKYILRKNIIEQFPQSKESTLEKLSTLFTEDFSNSLRKIQERRNKTRNPK